MVLDDDERQEQSLIEQCVLQNQKHLKELSSWGIGGPCSYFLHVSRPSQLIAAIRYCRARSIPFLIIGKGSNCLFDDRGFDGLVMLNRLDQFEAIEPGVYRVGSGYPFNRLGVRCSVEGFSGLEFAGGIPGTVGGAVFMNAGADGQETGHVIDSVEMVTMDGEVRVLRRSDLAFGYRRSTFQQMEDLAAIVAVTFRLVPAETARERQRALLERRRKTQPIGERSAGSVFRNPSGIGVSAGELIEMAGLKGLEMGGAKVSKVHANFFINFNGSTSTDMLGLMNHVKERVDQMFGLELKEEIRYIPYRTQTV
ncbi:UDP-N-acetylenolpyruvoylglucosamine reductase-like [Phoenix dactylifera]|uniref:UDP-N-acetylmuramate dehydrogenase n=1 Tax=Phoenix dactylifera TaxID=42345 RepID=A0A8B7CV56_PHODC|nr:UDP-N-acetylenolpyruvoylglucosamine reductase-like [Phoenix dactylifera]